MKTRLVIGGTNAAAEPILIAVQLRAQDNQLDIWTMPKTAVSHELDQQLHEAWRNGETVEMPAEAVHSTRELSLTESLLPEDITAERADLITRAQNEWHFVVLSTKLYADYLSELQALEDRVAQMSDYSAELWESLKTFWDKVQQQVKERYLYREHSELLRTKINVLFEQLKAQRTAVNRAFDEKSKNMHGQFVEMLTDIEQRISEGTQRFPAIFEDLKQTQSRFKEAKMNREHSTEIWNRLDTAFKTLKDKQFGTNTATTANTAATGEISLAERLQRRLDGLMPAINKMQESLNRDIRDMQDQDRKIAYSGGQLEEQLRQARLKMTQDRMRSKEEKLAEMNQTRSEIEQKIQNIQERDAKRLAQQQAQQQAQQEKVAAQAAAKAQAKAEKAATQAVVAETAKQNIKQNTEAEATEAAQVASAILTAADILG